MNENGGLSLMQALTDAGSTLPTSSLKNVMLFRKTDGLYHPLRVDVGRVLNGKDPDLRLDPQDVVWVPFSYGKNILVNGASIAAAIGSATASGIIYTH
jgi:polysaccharide export outer membrane protein